MSKFDVRAELCEIRTALKKVKPYIEDTFSEHDSVIDAPSYSLALKKIEPSLDFDAKNIVELRTEVERKFNPWPTRRIVYNFRTCEECISRPYRPLVSYGHNVISAHRLSVDDRYMEVQRITGFSMRDSNLGLLPKWQMKLNRIVENNLSPGKSLYIKECE